jgi:NADPH:quinone reductase-like Zn-dependent oxidoreductase
MPLLNTRMKALITRPGGVGLVERDVPAPGPGKVLVRVAASPVNPSDLLFLADNYEVKKPPGMVAGFEGSGTVVAAGGGWMPRGLVGRRVAFAVGDGDGAWAEYAVVDAMRCAPLSGGVDFRQGSMLLTNPMTAVVLLQVARAAGHRAFVQNAAAGALGRMLGRLCARAGLPVVHLVRRAEQAASLRAAGVEHVVVTTEEGAADRVAELCAKLGARFAFDALGGDDTGWLATAMPPRSEVLVYGMLSGAPVRVDTHALVFRETRIRGFTMYSWLASTSLPGQLMTLWRAQARLGDDLRSEVRATFPLGAHADALALAVRGGSEGKVLFEPGSEAGQP